MSLLQIEKFKFDSASLTGTLQNLGTALANPGIKLQIINSSTVACIIQDANGFVNIEVPSGGTTTFDEAYMANMNVGSKYFLAKGEQLQIKQVTAAGTGSIIVHVVEDRIL